VGTGSLSSDTGAIRGAFRESGRLDQRLHERSRQSRGPHQP
jgi:hypothetical protein